jgi:uncharacterized DUF497 family protein
MEDSDFEWDEAKAESNWRKHGISFAMARDAFRDCFAVEWADDASGAFEERLVLLGMVELNLLLVVYTPREERIRILSARLAEPYERRRYHEENQT